MRRVVVAGGWLAAALALAAYAGTGDRAADGLGRDGATPLTIFAAASLIEAFTELADAFDAARGVQVDVHAAGSQTLAHQINQGAPADVYASSDPRQMAVVADAGNLAGPAEVFASNTLAIAVESGNPRGLRDLADLADAGVVVALPGRQVPAGTYARRALDAAGVTVHPASLEADVRAAMSRVALGEADAALVYASDIVAAGGRVDGVAIPREVNVTASYVIAAVDGAAHPAGARAFVDFVLDDDGQSILARHGLLAP